MIILDLTKDNIISIFYGGSPLAILDLTKDNIIYQKTKTKNKNLNDPKNP